MILVLCVVPLTSLFSQTEKGQWMLGISSRYSLNPIDAGITIPDLMTIGYSTVKSKSDSGDDSDATTFICMNLVPKAGYFVIDDLVVGLDLQMGLYSLDYPDDEKENGTALSVGPFVRYYFPTSKVLPYLEAGGTLGSLITKYEYSGDTEKSTASMNTWSLGAGITKSLGGKAAFDFMLGYLSTTIKNTEDNPDNYRTVIGTVGFKFGIMVFLGPKKDNAK